MESRRCFRGSLAAIILQVAASVCDAYTISTMIDLTGLWTVMNSGSSKFVRDEFRENFSVNHELIRHHVMYHCMGRYVTKT